MRYISTMHLALLLAAVLWVLLFTIGVLFVSDHDYTDTGVGCVNDCLEPQ